MFKSLQKSLNSAGQTLSREADKLGKNIDHAVAGIKSSPQLDLFKTGNVVQLVSRASGRCLQIVTSSTGQLVVDGLGQEGHQQYHAHWTIINEGQNIIRLHNNNNFMAIVNGITQMIAPPAATTGVETKFRLDQVDSFITFESLAEHGRHVGVLHTGQLKSAVATGKELDGQFGVRLIYSPYATTTSVATSTATTKKSK